MTGTPRRNVELKARDPAPARSLDSARRLGTEDRGEIHQRDRYFPVPHGRLKLREQTPGSAELIQYHRADDSEERLSTYRLVPVPDPETLALALASALGTGPEVVKHRHLFIWDGVSGTASCGRRPHPRGVRIHLDRVQGLGDFIEFEAVAPPESDLAAEHALVAELRTIFQIADADLIADGYAARLSAAR